MIKNLVGGQWVHVDGATMPIYNPATGTVIDQVPMSSPEDVDRAISAAVAAWPKWSRTPIMERVALMFKFKALLEENIEELAGIITRHHGKTLDEARGEIRRGIEVVDFACGAPTLLQGRTLRSVSTGVDQDLFRYSLGVVAGISPFNFPVMIPLWMFPLATVCGNTFVLKPSERTPLGAVRLAELFLEAGFPDGVLNMAHGAGEAVDAIIAHPEVRAISFVGSEPVARHVYQQAAAQGKRIQALGGAKNHIVVMPDADLDIVVPAILSSAFGNAGERCLAGSVVVSVGQSAETFIDPLKSAAEKLVVGPGDQPTSQIGPLIRSEHRQRVVDFIEGGIRDGAEVAVDGRQYLRNPGFFLGPTVLTGVKPNADIARDEIFGPVLCVSSADSLERAIEQANASALGNMAVIFTQSGRAAREFREGVEAGMIGVNVPVAQPFAFFPFSGWKNSFFGDLHVHGTDGVEFYTRKKVVVSRW
jgi:malonate-semialdehyde dehydrogenase (acetylating) / methylmalonate-semialdehyde dehydrogenase